MSRSSHLVKQLDTNKRQQRALRSRRLRAASDALNCLWFRSGNTDGIEEEIGDLFFALINASRLYGVDPEAALERTNKKFMARFSHIEQGAAKMGKGLGEMTLAEMEELWQEAKEK